MENREQNVWKPFSENNKVNKLQMQGQIGQNEKLKKEEHLQFLNTLKTQKVIKNLKLLNDLREVFCLDSLEHYPTTAYEEVELDKSSTKYPEVLNLYKDRNFKRHFKISTIIEVKNTFHVLQYKLSKEKYQQRDEKAKDVIMFHGTKQEFTDNICIYNFDKTKVVHHRFGYGIAYARDPFFASYYHRKNQRNNEKVMILANVLLGKEQLGTEDMIVPQEPSYTSTNERKSVIVKYDDASSYPLYIVHYEGFHRFRNARKQGIKGNLGVKL